MTPPAESAETRTEGRRFTRIALAIIVLFLAGVVVKLAQSVLFPFFLAVFLSYIINPVLDWLVARRIPKPLAVVLILLVTFSIVYLMGILLFESGKDFAGSLPEYGRRIGVLIRDLELMLLNLPFRTGDLSSILDSLNLERMASLLVAALGPFLSFLSNLFIVFLVLAFIVGGRGRLRKKIAAAFPPERARRIAGVLRSIESQVQRYLAIKTLMSLANGILVWAILSAFGMDFAVVHGFIAFLTNYIPNIGGLIATLIRVGFAFLQFGSFWTPFWIFLTTVGLDTVMSNILEPRLMGRGLGLSPVVVLFSLFFGGWLWGIPGMILAVPAVAMFRIIAANVPSLKPLDVMLGK